MANASSSVPSATPFNLPIELLKAFHRVDRILFARLVFDVDRDLDESMQVIAFWLWMERNGAASGNPIKRMLSLPDSIINLIADEAVQCLRSMSMEGFQSSKLNLDDSIPLTRNLTNQNLTLDLLYMYRFAARDGITRIYKEVCMNVLDDILQQAIAFKSVSRRLKENLRSHHLGGINEPFSYFSYPQARGARVNHGTASSVIRMLDSRLPASQVPCKDDIGYMLSELRLHEHVRKEAILCRDRDGKDASADDRTIFLTFSRGYPTFAEEVIDFVTRKFGDCVEGIHMQEVTPGEQPLYARLVVRSDAAVQVILDRREKVKFSINGKHVWARKYVFYKSQYPATWSPGESSSASSPFSPN